MKVQAGTAEGRRLHLPFPRHDRTAFISIAPRRCVACGACLAACRLQVLGWTPLRRHRHVHVDHPARCVGCARCVRACAREAITQE